jgi:hypothetical protein
MISECPECGIEVESHNIIDQLVPFNIRREGDRPISRTYEFRCEDCDLSFEITEPC